jgi:hypothetical protein
MIRIRNYFGKLRSESALEWKSESGFAVKSKFRSFTGLKMYPRRAVDAHSGGVGAQNGALEGMLTSGRRFITFMRIRIDFGRLDSDPRGQNDPQK